MVILLVGVIYTNDACIIPRKAEGNTLRVVLIGLPHLGWIKPERRKACGMLHSIHCELF